MDVACLGIFRQLLCPTPRMSTVYRNDGNFPTNPSLRPLHFHRRLSNAVPLPLPIHSTFMSAVWSFSSARSIHIVPFTFSSYQGFHIYLLSLLLPSYNFSPFTSLCVWWRIIRSFSTFHLFRLPRLSLHIFCTLCITLIFVAISWNLQSIAFGCFQFTWNTSFSNKISP